MERKNHLYEEKEAHITIMSDYYFFFHKSFVLFRGGDLLEFSLLSSFLSLGFSTTFALSALVISISTAISNYQHQPPKRYSERQETR